MGGCGSSLTKYGKVKSPVPPATTREGQPLLIDAQTKTQAQAQQDHDKKESDTSGIEKKEIQSAALDSEAESSGELLNDQRVVKPNDDTNLVDPVSVDGRSDLEPVKEDSKNDASFDEGHQTQQREDVKESQPSAEAEAESPVEESQPEAVPGDVGPENESSKQPEGENWQALIDKGEVRPDLSWHEAASKGELKTLEWLQSSTDSNELLDLRGEEKVTALHVAARSGQRHVCEWLLRQHADPASQDKTRGTPLHHAALGGHINVCQILLHPGQLWPNEECPLESVPDLTVVDLWRRTPLFKAAEEGHVQVVSLFLDKKAAVDKPDREGENVLHKAAIRGHLQALTTLLDVMRGTPFIDTTNNDGYSPLDLCVLHKQCEAGDLLVESGAKLVKDVRKKPHTLLGAVQRGLPFLCTFLLKDAPNVGPKSWKNLLAEVSEDGKTPLCLAVASGSPAIVEPLLQGRADVESIGPSGRRPMHEAAASGYTSMLEFLVRRSATLERTDSQGQNALFYAAANGQTQVCEWLLNQGLSVVAEDDREQTPMHMAASSGHVAVCKTLVDHAIAGNICEVSDLLQASDWEGFEPVHFAIRSGHCDACRFLLGLGVSLHKSLDYGITTLQLAAEHGHEEVVKLLLQDLAEREAGGDLVANVEVSKCRVSDGRNAWLLSASEGHLGCCKQFWTILKDADFSTSVDRHGRDSMLLAAMKGHVDVCKWLLEVQANPLGLDVVDACGWTPLHAAAAEGRREMVKWMLEAKADVRAVDEDGKSARDWAGLKGHTGLDRLLQDAEKKVEAATVT